jgi:hypothetical protein
MKRFVAAAALAAVLSFGFSGTASAQIVYGYSVPRAGGVVQGGTVLGPGGYRTFNSYYSPFTGAMTGQVYGQNYLGQAYGQTYGYNPWNGLNYQGGFYQPNYWMNSGGSRWGTVWRWGWLAYRERPG